MLSSPRNDDKEMGCYRGRLLRGHIRGFFLGFIFSLAMSLPCLNLAKADTPPPENLPEHLVQYLSDSFNKPVEYTRDIVRRAYYLGSKKSFPRPVDILAVIATESGFDSTAESGAGNGRGLMQVNPRVHKVKNLTNPSVNMAVGTRLLKDYRKQSKSDTHALVSYNQGPGSAKNTCSNVSSTCNTPYVEKVLRWKRQLASVLKKDPKEFS